MIRQRSKTMSKTILVGDSGSGKTTLIEKLATGTFDARTTATIGVDYKVFTDTYGREVKAWDTAGAERFRAVMSLYYRGADFCLLVFDASRQLGMRSVSRWASEVRLHAPECRMFLIGNKIDREQRACDTAGAVELAKELGFVGVAFTSGKHMPAQEIKRMIQPLFDVEQREDFVDDDKHTPLLGGIELEKEQSSRCCYHF